MKKVLLFSLALCVSVLGYSQFVPTFKNYHGQKFVKKDVIYAEMGNSNAEAGIPGLMIQNRSVTPNETHIGSTSYDIWSNYNTCNRTYHFEDGTTGSIFMFSAMYDGSSDDRGSGYNYNDGTGWGPMPTARVEDKRCGWGTYMPWGPTGEIVVAHNGVTSLTLSRREVKGEGDWVYSELLGPADIEDALTWPYACASGENNEYTHVIVNSYGAFNDQAKTILYSRSSDGGETWDIDNWVMDEWGLDYYSEVTQDMYQIASKGNTVAILYARPSVQPLLMKSTDNGESWEQIVFWEHPYPELADETDTEEFYCPDYSVALAIGDDGKVHLAFGIGGYFVEEGGAFIMTAIDGIGYWNEDMEPFSDDVNALSPPQLGLEGSEMVTDVNYIGWMPDINGDGEVTLNEETYSYNSYGLSTMPSLTVDANNNVFLTYATSAETFELGTYNFKHIMGRAFSNGGWGPIMDLTADIAHWFDECIYPDLAPLSDDAVYYQYRADGNPGHAVSNGDHDIQENKVYNGELSKADLYTGIVDHPVISKDNVSQNVPNPATESTSIKVHMLESASLSIEVTNIAGQKVLSVDKGQVGTGSHQFNLDVSSLQSGIYFYSVVANNTSVTKKMIVQ